MSWPSGSGYETRLSMISVVQNEKNDGRQIMICRSLILSEMQRYIETEASDKSIQSWT